MLLILSTSTGTVLASDVCQVSVVQALLNSTNAVDRRTSANRKHTKAVLAAWEGWGKDYLAKHGHPYVPPKRKWVNAKMLPPTRHPGTFQIECVPPELATEDMQPTAVLADFEPLDVLNAFPTSLSQPGLVAFNAPPSTGETPGGDQPDTPGPFFPGGGYAPPSGGGTPTPPDIPTTPVGFAPEPGSFVLLGTGLTAMWATRKRLAS